MVLHSAMQSMIGNALLPENTSYLFSLLCTGTQSHALTHNFHLTTIISCDALSATLPRFWMSHHHNSMLYHPPWMHRWNLLPSLKVWAKVWLSWYSHTGTQAMTPLSPCGQPQYFLAVLFPMTLIMPALDSMPSLRHLRRYWAQLIKNTPDPCIKWYAMHISDRAMISS